MPYHIISSSLHGGQPHSRSHSKKCSLQQLICSPHDLLANIPYSRLLSVRSGPRHCQAAGVQPAGTLWVQPEMSDTLAECAIDHGLTCVCSVQCFRYDAPAGTNVKALLQKCLQSILGSTLPYKETGDAEETALANTVIAGGLLLKYLTGRLQTPLDLLCYMHTHAPALLHLCIANSVKKQHDLGSKQVSCSLLVLVHQRALCFAAIHCCTSFADFACTAHVRVFAHPTNASAPIQGIRYAFHAPPKPRCCQHIKRCMGLNFQSECMCGCRGRA